MKLILSTHEPLGPQHELILQQLAAEGLSLQSALTTWKSSALQWSSSRSSDDNQLLLSLIYHHATSVYLSGTFDYHPTFFATRGIPTPTLSPTTIQTHVSAILTMVRTALDQTDLAAILFFFPLRVAGARVRTTGQMADIAGMLKDIACRGFVVADAFTLDLEDLWETGREG